MRIEDVARVFGLSESSIRRKVANGELRPPVVRANNWTGKVNYVWRADYIKGLDL